MKTSDEIDNRLNTILEGYKQRSLFRNSLQTCDTGDYGKDNEKGRLLTSILTQMETVELKTLANIAKLPMLFEPLCEKQGIAVNRLDVIRFFRPYQAIERILSNCDVPQSFFKLGCETYNVLIQRADKQDVDSGKPSGLVDVRHLIQLDGNIYDVVAMIQALIRMWSLVLESNLDCEKHTFVGQSRSVEADMWVNGDFFEAVTKKFSPKDINKQSQIVSPELAVVKQDIKKRLNRIEFHFRKRYERRDATQNLCGHDVQANTKEYQDFVMELQFTEDNLLHELYHLGDNIKKYLKICNRIEDKKKVVDNFLPYCWCGNYVNHLKHGSKGKKRPAIPGYMLHFFKRTGLKPTNEDRIIDCAFLININGCLEDGMEIAKRLIDMWLLFLRYHTDIDITETQRWIKSVRRKEFLGKAVYTAKIPDGVLDDAKQQVQERKGLNL